MGRAPTQDSADNRRPTVQAGLVGAAIHLKMILKLSASINRIEAGPLPPNSRVQRLANGLIQFLQLRFRIMYPPGDEGRDRPENSSHQRKYCPPRR